MITLVKKYASSRLNDGPFPDRYSSETGKMATFENRAVVGGHFALVRRSLFFEIPGTDSSGLLFPFSSLFLMSRGAPTAAAVATMVETMAEKMVA